MQLTTNAKKPIVALGLVSCTIGILLAFNFGNYPDVVHQETQPELTPIQLQPTPVVSIWYSPQLPLQDVQNFTAATSPSPNISESEVMQIVMILGLAAVLLSGLVIVRRRKPQESVDEIRVDHPETEATRILEMDHEGAREAIDRLSGSRRIEVLRSIVELGDPPPDPPVVHVEREQHELTKCG